MLLLCGAKTLIGQVRRDPTAIGTRAAGEHNGHGIDEPVSLSRDVMYTGAEPLFDEEFESRRQLLQPAFDALVGESGGEPLAPVPAEVVVDAALRGQPLHVPE